MGSGSSSERQEQTAKLLAAVNSNSDNTNQNTMGYLLNMRDTHQTDTIDKLDTFGESGDQSSHVYTHNTDLNFTHDSIDIMNAMYTMYHKNKISLNSPNSPNSPNSMNSTNIAGEQDEQDEQSLNTNILPPMVSGWLHRRDGRKNVLLWHKRWIILSNGCLAWRESKADKMGTREKVIKIEINSIINVITYDNCKNNKQMKKKLSKLDNNQSGARLCFVLQTVGSNFYENGTKEYIWKCSTIEERNKWVNAINQYIKYYQQKGE